MVCVPKKAGWRLPSASAVIEQQGEDDEHDCQPNVVGEQHEKGQKEEYRGHIVSLEFDAGNKQRGASTRPFEETY